MGYYIIHNFNGPIRRAREVDKERDELSGDREDELENLFGI